MNVIILQAMYYGIVMILTIMGMFLLLKGFLGQYLKVRSSFGRLVLVKVRSALRDYYRVGEVEEGFLVYKHNKSHKRLSLSDCKGTPFYKSLAVLWVDVDEDKNAISMPDYTPVSGYDAIKFDNLLKRALMKPTEGGTMEKIIIFLIIVAIVAAGISAYFSYNATAEMLALRDAVAQIAAQTAESTARITASSGVS